MKNNYLVLCVILLLLLLGNVAFHTAQAQSSSEPELPRAFLSTSYPALSGSTWNVASGGNFQAALNNAQPGDTIVLESGATYIGNFTLPNKPGSNWIIIRTSNLAGLSPEGVRVSLGQAATMPKILTPNSAPAIATVAGAHHYRLVGLEVGVTPGVSLNYGIVTLGDGSTAQTQLSAVPHDLTLDRCYIHGASTGNVARGVGLNSAASAIIDSYIVECHGVGFDSQAIAGWNGPGPFKIVNNYLEAAGENVMFGGADPHVLNLVPSDIEFCRNYCSKPLTWNPLHPSYAGIHWSVKNVFELKNAQRVLVNGNVFERCWVDGQTGFVILFTPRNQEGSAPWSVVQDVTFTNNIARHGAAGMQFLGHDDNQPSQQERRIKVSNNLFYDIGGATWGSNGRLFQIVSGTADVHLDHNTGIQTSNIITADGTSHTGFVYTNNITPHNDYGVMGSNHGVGNDSLNFYFPGYSFVKNVLVAGPSSVYPAGNYFPPALSGVGFMDVAADNYRLAPTSPYRNAGTDGHDLGADQDAIEAAITNQQAPPSNQPPQVSITASPVSGVAPFNVNLTANAADPDGTIAAYRWDFGDGQSASLPAVAHLYQSPGTFTARVTVTDNLGAAASASVTISVTDPLLPPGNEVVLYAAEATRVAGNWNVVADATAAGGARMWNPDAGVAKLTDPLASPSDYFEMTFYAVAGRPYRLWVRGKAQGDYWGNDSVFVQFSGSVSSAGAPVFRLNSTDATAINLEDCSGCGVQGWGWQDNGWGVGVMGPLIYFSTTGQQTLRLQVREDGMSIDQIVLSPQVYMTSAPGALKNDTSILSKSSGLAAPPVVSLLTPNGGQTLKFGSSYLITWSVDGSDIIRQNIELSLDGGSTWQEVVSALPGTVNSFTWLVPKCTTATARIRVLAWNRQTALGESMSARNFTITAKKK